MQKKLCKYCGDSFITSHNYKIICSKKECKEKYHHEKSYLKSTCEICGKEFEYRKSKPKRFCSKKCAQLSPEVKEKMIKSQKETFMEKYGVEHPMQTEEVKNNFKTSMLEKYGVEHALQSKEILEKQINTVKEKYGTDNVFQNEEVKKAAKQTVLRKYGEDNYRKTKDSKNRIYKNTYDKILYSDKFRGVHPEFDFAEFGGVNAKKYPFQCTSCNHTFTSWIRNGLFPSCPNCKSNTSMSYGHIQIYNFIKYILPGEKIKINDRTVLGDFSELDLYIPSRKIAIEFDGLYWHSESSGGKDKNYHINKTNQCKDLGIKLIHIFDTEWDRKKEIVQSVLMSVLGKNTEKIYARKCKIKPISAIEKNEFLIQNHLQGSDNSSVYYGLFYNNIIVSIMTFSKSRFDKSIEWEICRFCNKKFTSVVGAASRLVKKFKDEHSPKSIVTYSDRRYFDGSVYKSIGFTEYQPTQPNYWYIDKKSYILLNRINFQKYKLGDKLKIYDKNLTEWQNMQLNGYDRIWDCGNKKYVMVL